MRLFEIKNEYEVYKELAVRDEHISGNTLLDFHSNNLLRFNKANKKERIEIKNSVLELLQNLLDYPPSDQDEIDFIKSLLGLWRGIKI